MDFFKSITFVLLVFFMFFGVTSAVQLKSIQTLSLKEVNFSYNADTHIAKGIVKVLNPTHDRKDFKTYLIFNTSKDLQEILRLPIQKKVSSVKALSEKSVTFELDNISLPKGSYDVLFQLEVEGLGVSSVRSAGLLKIASSNEPNYKYSLKCNTQPESKTGKVPVSCIVNPAPKVAEDVNVIFGAKLSGMLEPVFKDSFTLHGLETDKIEFSLPTSSFPAGNVDVFVQLKSENFQSNISYFRFFKKGDYTQILDLERHPGTHNVSFYINGSLYSDNRYLLVGMLDFDKVCQYQEVDLHNIAPLHREFNYDLNKCQPNSVPFVVVYKKAGPGEQLTAENIIAYKGVGDKAVALSILEEVNRPETKALSEKVSHIISSDTTKAAALIFLALLLLIVALMFAKKKGFLGIFVALFIFAVPIFSVHAEIFDSLDAPKARFEVNFPNITKEVGQNDDIVFSFSAIDNFAGGVSKYPGAEADVWIDNASSSKVTIMNASDTNPTVIVSLSNTLSLGQHQLHFFVPASTEICGSAFDFSDFDQAVFDPQPCEFTVDFTVVPGSQISLTFYGQPKAVAKGSSSKLYWFSSGANSCMASDAWSGNKSLNNTTGFDTGAINSDFENFTLTCSNSSDSVSRTETIYTYTCGDNLCSQWEDCNSCSQDCGTCANGYSLSISASPQLIKEGAVSYITWNSSGYTSCQVSEDNPLVNDSWSRLAGVEKTSNLTKDTIYTVTCSDGANSESKSVRVRIVPKFIEF